MSAFATAMAALHADANIGTAADYRRPPWSWLPVRIVLSSPSNQIGALGGVGMRAGTTLATLLAGDFLSLVPARGDELRIAGAIHRVEDAEPDVLGITWRLVLSPTDPARPDVSLGAIRYDAWYAPATALTQAEAAALSPAQYHARAPLFANVSAGVTLPAATQAMIDAEIAQAVSAGLSYWAFLGWDPSDPACAALNFYRSSAHRSDISFCMIENMQGLYFQGSWLPNVARTIGLMTEPGYVRVLGNRPLLFINAMDDASIITRFGSMDGIGTVLAGIRSQAIAAGVGDPYIVMLDGWTVRAASLAAHGADAIGAYAALAVITSPQPFTALAAAAEQWWIDGHATSCAVVPTLMTGWDFRPRITTPNALFGSESSGNPGARYDPPTPAELTDHVASGVAWMAANSTAAPAQTALVYAWNEFTEGGWLCPTWLAGQPGGDTARLAALASVLKP